MRIFFLVFLVFIFSVNCFAQVNEDDPGCREKCSHANLFSRPDQVNFYQYPTMDKYDVKYLKLDLAVEAANAFISGTALTIVKAVQPLDSFVAEFKNNMIVDSVFINGTKMNFQRGSDHVYIPLSSTLPTGTQVSALFYYRGTVSSGAIFTGTIASNGLSYTATLSESYQAREWFPVKQVLRDKIDSADIWITTSATNKVGSNGLLVAVETLPSSKKLYKWKTRYPMVYYLPSFSVGNYFEYLNYAKPAAMAPDSILIQNYVANNTTYFNSIKTNLDKTPAFIEKYSELFGLYPFKNEKYGHAQANIGGGMEHQTMTTLSSFGSTLIAHELGHQWWGDNVTCATWNHIWLNEGFASYCEYLAIEKLPALFTPTTAASFMQSVHTNVLSVSNGSVYVPDASLFDENRIFSSRLSYNKGSAIIHNLRFEMQDDNVFFQTLKNYQQQYKDSTATANDFKLVAETTSGKNFTDFFNQWYYGEGYPTFNIAYSKQGSDTLILAVNETVSASTVTSFFKGLFEFKITSTQGDTIVKANVTFNNQQFKFYYPKTPNGIVIDPNNWVLNANGTITNGLPGFDFNNPAATSITCSGPTSASITLGTTTNLGYNNAINLSASGLPPGTTISFGTNPVIPGNNTVVTLNNTHTLSYGTYNITITGISGSITKTRVITYIIQAGTAPTITTQPVNQTICAGQSATFNVIATGTITSYQWQLGTDGGTIFNNISLATGSSYTVFNSLISQNNYRYRVIVSTQCGSVTSNAALLTVTNCSITVNLKLFLQGYYLTGNTMQPVLNNHSVPASLSTETDSITVELHHPTTFALIDSKKAVLLTNGNISVTFIQPAGSYYIGIRHRNTVETWTATIIACTTSTPLYNFSTAANKAYGDNQVQVGSGVWAFFTGDLNRDEFIDSNDFPAYDTDSFNGVNSEYKATDMNGDGFVDGNDFPVFDNNSFNGVSSIHP